MRRAETLLEHEPDSAYALIDALSPLTHAENDADCAHWCMLAGRLTNIIYSPLPSSYLLERSSHWYERHGTLEEQARIELYWARALAEEGEDDEAMRRYLAALEKAEAGEAVNVKGYIYMYMAESHAKNGMHGRAVESFRKAAGYFKQAGNLDSQLCVWRDMGREYTFMDSLGAAESVMRIADSLARYSKHPETRASVINHWGNIYLLQGKNEEARRCFLSAIEQGGEVLPNKMALVNCYVSSGAIDKAHALLDSLPQGGSREHRKDMALKYYWVYLREEDYKSALDALGSYVNISDTLAAESTQNRVATIESKYNYLKVQKRNGELELRQQRYLFIGLLAALLLVTLFVVYWRRIRTKILAQELAISRMRAECLTLSAELEKRKTALARLKEEGNAQAHEELKQLQERYKELRHRLLKSSEVYKRLKALVDRKRSVSGGLTKEQWQEIFCEVNVLYPKLDEYLRERCEGLSEADWRYCYLLLFGFDSQQEACLLDILPGSIRTKRTRLRQRMNIAPSDERTLADYLNDETA